MVKQIEYGRGIYNKANGKCREVFYIVIELAKGGNLMDLLMITGRFSEKMARFFFKQLIMGLIYCHRQGVTHRDLKPDNLLLDDQCKLKIGDFGFAAPIEGRDGSGFLRTYLGTQNYMAPEFH